MEVTESLSDKHFVGLKLTGFEDNGKNLPVSRVTLKRDDNNMVTAGDDTGMELVADCPHATQAMCDAVLEQVRGYRYHAFTADDAGIDPAAELGDGVTAAGCYSVVSRLDDDGSGYPSLSAPGEPEIEDEFPTEGPVTQEFNRKVTGVYSYINKTAEEIQLGVKDELNQVESSVNISLQGFQQQVNDTNGTLASLKNTVDGFSATYATKTGVTNEIKSSIDGIGLSVTNGEKSSSLQLTSGGQLIGSAQTIRFNGNVVFESDLANGTTSIDGGCIDTGQIDAEYLKLYGPIAVYEDRRARDLSGFIGYVEGRAYNDNGNVRNTYGIGVMAPGDANTPEDIENGDITYYGGSVICTNAGARLTYGTDMFGDTTTIACVGGHCYSSEPMETFSDRRLKSGVVYDIAERFGRFFRALRPCRFKMRGRQDGPQHIGFIAQEMKSALEADGMKMDDLAALSQFPGDGQEEGMYTIRYGELAALNTAMIQSLLARVDALENEVNELKGRLNDG